MIKNMAIKLTDVLISHQTIEEQNKKVYVYGAELLLSTGLALISILAMGLIFNVGIESIVFLSFFMPIRTTCSGYHAKTHESCFFLALSIAAMSIWSSILLPSNWLIHICMLLIFICSELYIFFRGPYKSQKNKISQTRYMKNKKLMHKIQLLEGICFGLFVLCKLYTLINIATITTFVVACMIYIAKKEEKSVC